MLASTSEIKTGEGRVTRHPGGAGHGRSSASSIVTSRKWGDTEEPEMGQRMLYEHVAMASGGM